MFYFLDTTEGLKKLIPNAEQVKERIEHKEQILNTYFDDFVKWIIDFTPKFIFAVILLFFGWWLIRKIVRLTERAMLRRRMEISLRTFVKSLVNIGLKLVLIVMVAGVLGIGTTGFVTMLGAASLAVGLALQGSLSNFAGGVLILIFKPFKVGDSIEAGGQSGEVKEIQIFNTIMLTADHKTVILPNGPLSNGTIINSSRHGNLRVDVHLSVYAGSDLNAVKKIISDTLERNSMVLKEPKPGIFVGKIIDGVISIHVKPYCAVNDSVRLPTELYVEFKNEFEKNGIPFPVPRRVHQNVT